MNRELPDVQAGFRKGRGTRHQIANIRWIMEKARQFQKNIYFCFIDYAKAFDCVDHKLWPLGLVHWQASWPPSIPSGQDVSLSEEESHQSCRLLQEEGPLPGPETGLLSNTRK